MRADCVIRWRSRTGAVSAIANQIRISLTPREQAALKDVKVVNTEAYESYLKGRYFWNKRTADGLKVALAYFRQAVEEDPKYAQAYSGLADTYALLGYWRYAVTTPKEAFPKAKAAAIKSPGTGQFARRGPQLACIRPGWLRLEF